MLLYHTTRINFHMSLPMHALDWVRPKEYQDLTDRPTLKITMEALAINRFYVKLKNKTKKTVAWIEEGCNI